MLNLYCIKKNYDDDDADDATINDHKSILESEIMYIKNKNIINYVNLLIN